MKKLLIFTVTIAAVAALRADTIYWMLSDQIVSGGNSRVVTPDGTDTRNGANYQSGSDIYAYLMWGTDENSYAGRTQLDSATGAEVAEAYDLGEYITFTGAIPTAAKSFWVETYNGLQTNPMTVSAMESNGYLIRDDTLSVPQPLASGGFGQVAGTTYNVPEPTSGLLFLVGGMLLGLKRRRMA